MSRYIDADAFLKSVKQKAYPQSGINESERRISLFGIMEILTSMPTADVVEVIRCEHCLHWDDEKDGVYVGNLYHCCDYDGEYKDPCDFCSYGERREDEKNR